MTAMFTSSEASVTTQMRALANSTTRD